MIVRAFAPLCALVALALAACSAPESEAPAGPSAIRVDGSSTVFPLSQAVAAGYGRDTQGAAVVEVAESGTGAGFEKFCAGEVDIAGASRPILSREIMQCFRAGVRYVEAPIGFDGITVIVHPSNTLNAITLDQLRAVWRPEAQGTVTTWRQADSRWPDRPLVLFGPGAASGTFDYFTQAVMGQEDLSRTDYTASEDDEVIVNGVAGEANALGYVGLAYYERNRERLKALQVDGGEGPVAPNADSVRGGDYHPLSRPLFIYVNAASLDRPEVMQFAEYYINHAAASAAEVGYVALPETAYPTYLERVQNRRTGTAFSGRESTGETIEEVIGRPLIEPSA